EVLEQLDEAADVVLVERRVHLVHDAERARLHQVDAEEQRERRERALAAGEQVDALRALAARRCVDLDGRLERILRILEPDVGLAALEEALEGRSEVRADLLERADEEIRGGLVDLTDRGAQVVARGDEVLALGGEADIWLQDPEDPLESPIEIHASPRGKRTQRIDLLSGGERAHTALSLLFGIYLVKPSPFCVMDEVDAPLDENNIGRFIKLLQDFKGQTQFVVITHNPRTIEAADWIYGVTMEEPGISTIVGVRLEEALEAAAGAA
ncbi:MAG TPA: hypothetical protein VFQ22_07065, partial [Longimicrobiales bacterium]|nr:hypothetical protein [Longimicrobiales bacterium]